VDIYIAYIVALYNRGTYWSLDVPCVVAKIAAMIAAVVCIDDPPYTV